MSFRTGTEEYQDLLAAQRVLRKRLDDEENKLGEVSQATRALVDLVRLKRDIRGIPDPKPVDASQRQARKRRAADSRPVPIPVPAPVVAPPVQPEPDPGSATTGGA